MTNKRRERQIRNECMILYREEGHTLKEVAELFRVSQTTARTVCGGETKAEKEKRNEDMRLFKAQGHTMQEVADKFNVTKHTAQMICSKDHIIPLAKGGEHSWDNIQLAHRICNSLKADKVSS